MPDVSVAILPFAAGILAGVSNAIAAWPGHALAVVGYRKELQGFPKGMADSIIIALRGGTPLLA